MVRHLKITDGKLLESGASDAQVLVYSAPDDAERQYLMDQLKVDEHTLNSALDPDEPARLEFEPEHTALILKRPKSYASADDFLFRVASIGLFLFKDRLIIVAAEDGQLFEGKPNLRMRSLQDAILKLLYRCIYHFEQHLKVINTISAAIELEINTAMENKHLLNLFTLEKSLVYYLNAINSNSVLIGKLRTNAAKLGFTPENLEALDDIVIENSQCHEQAHIYSNILASLMDARASIVANNLNVLMKNLNLIMIALMLPTLVVSIFSMNVALPIAQEGSWSFWLVMALATAASSVVALIWWRKRVFSK